MNIPRAVISLRVSTDEQAETGTSMEAQELACLRKAQELSAHVVGIYRDEGVSGAFYLSRPGIQAALADIEAGRADLLIVYSISRLSRDVEHQQIIKKRIEQAGARLIICDMPIEDTAEGGLMFGVSGAFAEYERKLIRKRTMSGRRRRAEEGVQPARSRPAFGYTVVTKQHVLRGEFPAQEVGRYQVNTEQAPWVGEIFRRYASGQSLHEVARFLNTTGVPTPQGAQRWCLQSITVILTNPVYKGQAVFGRKETVRDEKRKLAGKKCDYYFKKADAEKWVIIDAPALIEPNLWQQCQERLQQNKRAKSGPKRKYLLASLVYCLDCGGRMYAHNNNGRRHYRCRTPYGATQHREKAVSAERLEADVSAAFQAGIRHPELTRAALNGYARQLARRLPNDDLTKLQEEIRALEAKEKAAVTAQIAGIQQGMNPHVYQSVFAELAAERKWLTERLEKAQAVHALLPDMHNAEEQLQAVYAAVEETLTSEDLTPGEKQVILARIIHKIVPIKEGVLIYLRPESSQSRNLVLIGFMGTGKSTVGRICAARLGFTFRDSDKVIEARAGCSIPQLFAERGEAAFRLLEREVIAELACTPGLVIATGGGAVLDPENVQNLRAGGLVVHLTASPAAIGRRVGDARSRPLLADAPDPQARIAQMLTERAPYYARAAHHQVETSGRPPKAIMEEIAALFKET